MLAIALALAACLSAPLGSPPAATAPLGAPARTAASPGGPAGGVTASAEAPSGGLVVRLASVRELPAADGAHCDPAGRCAPTAAAGLALVRVTVALTAPAAAVPLELLPGTSSGITLRVRGVPAEIDCGYPGQAWTLCSDQSTAPPSRVPAGGTVLISEAFDVPRTELTAPLSVVVSPPVATGGAGAIPAVTLPARIGG